MKRVIPTRFESEFDPPLYCHRDRIISRKKVQEPGLRQCMQYVRERIELNCQQTESRAMIIVEVGCYAGHGTSIILQELPESAVIHCVDSWEPYDENDQLSNSDLPGAEREFDALVAQFNGRVIKRRMKSEEAAKTFADNSVKFAYIDANHQEIENDIDLWFPKVEVGGFIGGHDFEQSSKHSVLETVYGIFGEPDRRFEDTSWVVQKEVHRLIERTHSRVVRAAARSAACRV